MKKYKVTYKQKDWGKILNCSYTVYAENDGEMERRLDALFHDPAVISANYEEIEEFSEENAE